MKTLQILALATLSLGFLSIVEAATVEIVNNTKEALEIRPVYKDFISASTLVHPGKTGYISEGYTKLVINPDLGIEFPHEEGRVAK